MAKIKLTKSFKDFGEELKLAIAKVKRAPSMYDIGTFASEVVRKRTRFGYGVAKTGDQRQSLKPLSDKYKDLRKKLALAPETTASKSNLTNTGQLLDSISVISASEGKVTFGPQGPRDDSDVSNDKLGGYVAEQGRPFNNLSAAEIKQVQQEVQKRIRDLIEE